MSGDLVGETLKLTRAWCRIPSFAGNQDGLARQASEITDWLAQELGAEIISAQSHSDHAPVIHARIDVGAARTITLYNMYDVMPAARDGWRVAPFEGGVATLDGVGEVFVARGSENNKGPLAGQLCVLRHALRERRLKVNVELLIEGEEESGSHALRSYLARPDCPVRKSVAALFPSFCEYGGGPVRLYLGFSGIAKGKLSVTGGQWGGPMQAIHSSNASWIGNPARRLIEAIALCGTGVTGQVDQIELDEMALALTRDLAEHFDPANELRYRHTHRYAVAGSAFDLLNHALRTASFNIASLTTHPANAKAVIPSEARASFDLRCPPGLDPSVLCDRLTRKFAASGLEGVALDVLDAYPGHRSSADTAGVRALMESYRRLRLTQQIWPWSIGSAPAYAFDPYTPCFLIGGAGRGGNAHGVDEFLDIDGLQRFLVSLDLWLSLIADIDETGL